MKPEYKKRFALYARVSTDKQKTDNQKIRLIDYAESMDYEYEYIEESESTRGTRPKKAEVLRRLRNKEFDGVIITKLDRWARSINELTLEIEELVNKNIMFISLGDNIDLSTATGKLQFHILSAFAEFERELIKERTMDGLARARKEGKTFGRPKGKKDQKVRKKGGYYMRYQKDK